MKDLKEYLLINDLKLLNSLSNSNKLGALKNISNDINYWKEIFTFNSNRKALESFLLYRTACSLNLYNINEDDVDITKPALNELENRLRKLPDVKDIKVGKKIHSNEKVRSFKLILKSGEELFLESDTANSLMRDLADFLRKVLKKEFKINCVKETYIEEYNLERNRNYNYYLPFRNYYFYTVISKVLEESKDHLIKDCLDALEIRAQLTHQLSNIILVPYGYNRVRGWNLITYKTKMKINDRLDLTFLDFNEMIDDASFTDEKLKIRLGNTKCTISSITFLMNNRSALFPKAPLFDKSSEGSSIEAILKRSEIISQALIGK